MRICTMHKERLDDILKEKKQKEAHDHKKK